MTVEINVHCDGLNCSNSREIDSDSDMSIERVKWGIDYKEGFHYCPECWEEVEKEIEERDE